ncbi:S8 family serine peptidase [Novosphingobium sp. KCTC 2891]|uniref:S8 family serine peptidase n=1 Tax=Novosphingobium sp. KCTC 2891 TaxID=2989730 RepID=UPI002223D371|nr:S8 family serine peptidase [Novosphingobium sp. KCTC 2891]MCW1383799.1 S8 family serine peptidase [Novosphingobium sp. KCTC 2891]
MPVTPFGHLLAVTLIALGSLLPVPVHAQTRGGPPMGMPGGGGFAGPMGGGPPVGSPVHLPDIPVRGRPAWAGVEAVTAATERATQAVSAKLSKVQRDRAADRVKQAPGLYELDRKGALSIRGEVMVTGLDGAALAHLAQSGFAVLRRDKVPGVDMDLAVVSRTGLDITHAIRMLRKIAPEGTYAPNHVLFESGLTANARRPSRGAQADVAGGEGVVTVGLVDTGVAPAIDSDPRIHMVRRNFAAGESRPGAHGTAVAALLARERGRLTLYAADIFGSDVRGGTSELLVRALGWMATSRVPVVNVSMVGPANPIVALVVARLTGLGFTIVAPVGNDGGAARPLYPASYPGVVAVSAVGANGRLLPEASRVRRVDFVAPGIATVPDPAGRPTEVRGTSFATPIVSRLIADRVRVPDVAAAQRAIRALATGAQRPRGDAGAYGHGMIGL